MSHKRRADQDPEEIRLRPLTDRIAAVRGAFADLAPGHDLADELIAVRVVR